MALISFKDSILLAVLGSWFLFFFFFFLLFYVFSFFVVVFIFYFILFFNFTILYWFCHTSKWIRHRYTCVPHPEPSSLLPPYTIPPGHPSAPAPSIFLKLKKKRKEGSSGQFWDKDASVSFSITRAGQSKSIGHSLPASEVPKRQSLQPLKYWLSFSICGEGERLKNSLSFHSINN